jgi:outer membrane immunogenic protein
MRKLLVGATAIAALFTGPALSADMPRPVTKAPPAPVAVYNWTGCYVKGGGGYGMWNQDTTFIDGLGREGPEIRTGGRGWFGTVGGGCDYQLAERWVIGAYGDYDFSSIKGDLVVTNGEESVFGREKLKSAWAVGGRIGYLITPAVLTYVGGGFTEARFSGVDLSSTDLSVPQRTHSGWFLGSGYEYNLGWLPGLFWRTEYRYAQYDRKHIGLVEGGELRDESIETRKTVQTIRSELVWRFNWGGPVRAGY